MNEGTLITVAGAERLIHKGIRLYMVETDNPLVITRVSAIIELICEETRHYKAVFNYQRTKDGIVNTYTMNLRPDVQYDNLFATRADAIKYAADVTVKEVESCLLLMRDLTESLLYGEVQPSDTIPKSFGLLPIE